MPDEVTSKCLTNLFVVSAAYAAVNVGSIEKNSDLFNIYPKHNELIVRPRCLLQPVWSLVYR